MIAHSAIKNGLPLLHKDRDFDIIAKFTKLKVISPESDFIAYQLFESSSF